jgi:hypothetical protein
MFALFLADLIEYSPPMPPLLLFLFLILAIALFLTYSPQTPFKTGPVLPDAFFLLSPIEYLT